MRSISEENDSELEREVQRLNRTTKKTFQVKYFWHCIISFFLSFFLFFFKKKNFLDFTILSMFCFLRNSPFLHVQVVLTCFSSIYENFKYIYIYICSIATKNFHISVKCEQMKIKETWKNLRLSNMEETIPKAFIFRIWSVEIYSWTCKFLENIKANNKKIIKPLIQRYTSMQCNPQSLLSPCPCRVSKIARKTHSKIWIFNQR